jgi:cysteine desulfurase
LNVSLPTLSSQEAVRALDHAGFAVSAGSACASGGGEEPSHVLLAMGLGVERASRALRISLGPTTTSEELNEFVAALEAILVTV